MFRPCRVHLCGGGGGLVHRWAVSGNAIAGPEVHDVLSKACDTMGLDSTLWFTREQLAPMFRMSVHRAEDLPRLLRCVPGCPPASVSIPFAAFEGFGAAPLWTPIEALSKGKRKRLLEDFPVPNPLKSVHSGTDNRGEDGSVGTAAEDDEQQAKAALRARASTVQRDVAVAPLLVLRDAVGWQPVAPELYDRAVFTTCNAHSIATADAEVVRLVGARLLIEGDYCEEPGFDAVPSHLELYNVQQLRRSSTMLMLDPSLCHTLETRDAKGCVSRVPVPEAHAADLNMSRDQRGFVSLRWRKLLGDGQPTAIVRDETETDAVSLDQLPEAEAALFVAQMPAYVTKEAAPFKKFFVRWSAKYYASVMLQLPSGERRAISDRLVAKQLPPVVVPLRQLEAPFFARRIGAAAFLDDIKCGAVPTFRIKEAQNTRYVQVHPLPHCDENAATAVVDGCVPSADDARGGDAGAAEVSAASPRVEVPVGGAATRGPAFVPPVAMTEDLVLDEEPTFA